jgi:hypothetical protein
MERSQKILFDGAGQTAEDQPQGRGGKRMSLYNDWNKYSAPII